MPRRRREPEPPNADVTPAPAPTPTPTPQPEAFFENISESKPRVERVSFGLDASGRVDWESMRAANREKVLAVIRTLPADPNAASALGLGGPFAIIENEIKPEHVCSLLEVLAFTERLVFPPVIFKESKGRIKLSPQVVETCFQFSDEAKAKLGPSGATAFNFYLPSTIRGWIIKGAAGSEFASVLAGCIKLQVESAIAMQLVMDARQVHSPENGEARAPVMSPVPSGMEDAA